MNVKVSLISVARKLGHGVHHSTLRGLKNRGLVSFAKVPNYCENGTRWLTTNWHLTREGAAMLGAEYATAWETASKARRAQRKAGRGYMRGTQSRAQRKAAGKASIDANSRLLDIARAHG